MSTTSNLTALPRVGTGSRDSRKLRAEGRVPVNVYGHGLPNASLTLEAHALGMALNTAAQVFTLVVNGKEEPCLVGEVQYDTYGQRVLHVDFTRVDLTEEVEVEVTLEFTGHPVGVNEGGQLVTMHPSLSVRCRADAIPDVVIVDISGITLGHSIHAGEIVLPAGVKLDLEAMDPEEPIVGVVVAKEDEPAEDEAEEGEGAAKGDAAKPAEGDKDKD